MGALVPNTVTIVNLADVAHAVNVINPAAAQAVSPRFSSTDVVIVEVTGSSGVYYVQRALGGEWIRNGAKDGQADDVTYPQIILPV